MQPIRIRILSFCLLALMACNENEPIPSELDCPTLSGIFFWNATAKQRGYDFYSPVFNPKNSHEFIYIRQVYNQTDYFCQLRKRNILTQQDVVLATGYGNPSEPTWAKSGWILFRYDPSWPAQNIWKIKDNGTGLTRLTHSGDNDFPDWKPDGSLFIYNRITLPIIADPNGVSLDTLPLNVAVYEYSFSHDDKILFSKQNGPFNTMAIFDLTTQTITSLENVAHYYIFEWMPDGIHFVGNRNYELWLVNTQTEEQILIKDNCGDRYRYWDFSIAPDGLSLLAERIEITVLDSLNYDLKNNIVHMRIDGSHETVLDLEH